MTVSKYDRRIKGCAFPSLSARKVEAILWLQPSSEGDIAVLVDEQNHETLARAPWRAVTLDPRLGHLPRKLSFANGAVFETDDFLQMESILGTDASTRLHQVERFSPRLLLVIGLCGFLAWFIWRYVLDLVVAVAIWLTPAELITQIDRSTIASLDAIVFEPSSLAQEERGRVSEIFDTLTQNAKAPPKGAQFNLLFRDSEAIGANAMALPGGTIVITDAMVENFGDTDMLAGVLGHEIGHVTLQHSLYQLYRSLGIYVLVAYIAGDTGVLIEDLLLQGNTILALRYSREAERNADIFGVELVAKAGFDPRGLAAFFSEIASQEDCQSDWLETHPKSSARAAAINAQIEGLP